MEKISSRMKDLKRQMLSDVVNWMVLYSCQVKFRHGRFTDECESKNS